jgi:hypothetical protein
MPIHDWTRVDAGIFHDFHQIWSVEIMRVLNAGLLPGEFYALVEQHGGPFVPDVLTLKARTPEPSEPIAGHGPGPGRGDAGGGVLTAEPRARIRAETSLDVYRRKQNSVAVRHVSDDELVAVVEIVSRGNKNSRKSLDDLVKKAGEFLDRGVNLLILDLQPPTPRDPQGIHGAIWDYLVGDDYVAPIDKPLTLAAYESDLATRAYVEPVAVGDELIDMPLFLRPGAYVPVPLEATYRAAWEAVPRRWRDVVAPPAAS